MNQEWRWGSMRTNKQRWRMSRLEALLLGALLLTLLLVQFATHPGLHVAGVTILLDVLIWKRELVSSTRQWVVILCLNIIAVVVIAFGSDPVELWLTGFYGMYVMLLLLVTARASK